MSPESDNASAIGCLVLLGMLGAVGLFIWVLLPGSWTDPWKYSVIYDTHSDNVHFTEKPKDCDFIHAPLGDKACHYKKVVYCYNSRGELIAGDGAPKYSPDTRVVKVEIDWVKVEE